MQILIAGEDPALSLFLKQGLELDACEVQCARDLTVAPSQPPDLLVLDLPHGERGSDMLTRVRSGHGHLPILVLLASSDAEARIGCLDRGADDCMIKPLSLREVRARCRALLRRRPGGSLVLRCEGLELDRVSRRVEREGQTVTLTPTEFSLLEQLMLHPGNCVSREALLAQVWSHGPPADSNIVDVYINYLRRKLGNAGASPLIQTVRGRGYLVGIGNPRAIPLANA